MLGTCFLARRYLRLRAPDGREEHLGRQSARWHPVYACTAARSSLRQPGACGAVLFERRDILSKQHCWDAGGGPERAFFVNHLRPGAVVVRNERQEVLCQVWLERPGGGRVGRVSAGWWEACCAVFVSCQLGWALPLRG